MSPRDLNPQRGKHLLDGKPGARTIILPLTVWAADPQRDSEVKCRSIKNQVALTAGVQEIHTYIYRDFQNSERFKFGIFYLLIIKIRYNFTHK